MDLHGQTGSHDAEDHADRAQNPGRDAEGLLLGRGLGSGVAQLDDQPATIGVFLRRQNAVLPQLVESSES